MRREGPLALSPAGSGRAGRFGGKYRPQQQGPSLPRVLPGLHQANCTQQVVCETGRVSETFYTSKCPQKP